MSFHEAGHLLRILSSSVFAAILGAALWASPAAAAEKITYLAALRIDHIEITG